jgi:nucleoside-diphosphate-sugar epimerase
VIGNGALAVFDAPLDQAVQTNALGPLRLLDFARGGARRPFVAHVSTCYVGNVAGPVFESPLAPDWTPAGPDPPTRTTSIGRSNGCSPTSPGARRRRDVERRLVDDGLAWARRRGWRDTYTFTKAMGEQLFARHRGDVPGLVLRPSIIESALRTPSPGWIDGYRMMDPLIVGYARRQLTEFPGHPEAVLDVVPVDTVVNALLMAIPFTHVGEGPDVYQVASGADNPLRMKAFCADVREHYQAARRCAPRSGEDDDLPAAGPLRDGRFLRRLEVGHLRPVRALEAAFRLLERTAWGRRRARPERAARAAGVAPPHGADLRSVRREPVALHGVQRAAAWRRCPRRTAPRSRSTSATWTGSATSSRCTSPAWSASCCAGPTARHPSTSAAAGPATAPTAQRRRTRATDRRRRRGDAAPRRSGWPGAEQVLALTRETSPAEATAWTTPDLQHAIRRASLQAPSAWRRACASTWRGRGASSCRSGAPSSWWPTTPATSTPACCWPRSAPREAHPPHRRRRLLVPPAGRGLAAAAPPGRHPVRPAAPQRGARPGAPGAGAAQRARPDLLPRGDAQPRRVLQPFRSTVGLLALASAAPIVPAAISGAAQALPKGRIWIAHHPVRVRSVRRSRSSRT